MFSVQFIFAQNEPEKNISSYKNKPIYLEAGINSSLPVHIEMYRTHRLAIGINEEHGKTISEKWELGLRAEYDYRFS